MNLDFTKRLEEVANSHSKEFMKICAEREIFTAFAKLEMTLKNYGPSSSNVNSLKDELCHLFDLVGMECESGQDFRYYAKKVKDFETGYMSFGAKTIEEEFNNRVLLSIYGLCREHFTPEDYMFRIVNSLEKEDSKWDGDSLRVRILKKFIKQGNFMEYKYEKGTRVLTKKLVGGKDFITNYVKGKIGRNPDIEEILANIDDSIYKKYEEAQQDVKCQSKEDRNKKIYEKLTPFLNYLLKDYIDKYFAEMESSLRIEFDVEKTNLIKEINKIKQIEACNSIGSNKLKKLDEFLKCLDKCKSEFLDTNDYKSLVSVLERYCKNYLDEYYAFKLMELKDNPNKKAKIESHYNNKKNELEKYNKFLKLRDDVLTVENLESCKAYNDERDGVIDLFRNMVNEYNKQIEKSSLESEQYGKVKSFHTLYKLTEKSLLQRKIAYESVCAIIIPEIKKYYDEQLKIETYLENVLDKLEPLKNEYVKNCTKGNCYDAQILVLENYREKYLKTRYEKQKELPNVQKDKLTASYYAMNAKINGYIDLLKIRAAIPADVYEILTSAKGDCDDYVEATSLLNSLNVNNDYLKMLSSNIVKQYNARLVTGKHNILDRCSKVYKIDDLYQLIKNNEEQNALFCEALLVSTQNTEEGSKASNEIERIMKTKEYKCSTEQLLYLVSKVNREDSIYSYIQGELLRKINKDLKKDKKEIQCSVLDLYILMMNSEQEDFKNRCYVYLYSIAGRVVNKSKKYVEGFVEFVSSLKVKKTDESIEHIIQTFDCENGTDYEKTIKALNEYINQRHVEVNRKLINRNKLREDRARSRYYKEKEKIKKYIYAFENMKSISYIEKIIDELKRIEQNIKSTGKNEISLDGDFGLLKLADDLAFGKFRSNGYTRQVLYWTAMIYGMKYKQYLDMKHSIDSDYNNEIKPIEDFEKSLFRDYYADNWIRRITNAYRNNVTAFDFNLTDQGINYKNFVEFIMIYYIVKEGYTPEEKIKRSDEMVNRIIVKHKERKVTDIKRIKDSTKIFKKYYKVNIFDYDEKDFEEFILNKSAFNLNVANGNESVYQIATKQNSAVSEYEKILKDIVGEDPDSDEGQNKTTFMYDKDFYKVNCSYGLQFAESFNTAKDSKDNLTRSNFIARIEAYERENKFFNENSPFNDNELSERAEKFFYLIDKIHQYLKNVLSTPIKKPEDMSRNRLLAAIYYLYNYNMDMGETSSVHLSLNTIYKEMRKYDKVLEKCNYAKLSSKNILDGLIILATYMRLNEELNE